MGLETPSSSEIRYGDVKDEEQKNDLLEYNYMEDLPESKEHYEDFYELSKDVEKVEEVNRKNIERLEFVTEKLKEMNEILSHLDQSAINSQNNDNIKAAQEIKKDSERQMEEIQKTFEVSQKRLKNYKRNLERMEAKEKNNLKNYELAVEVIEEKNDKKTLNSNDIDLAKAQGQVKQTKRSISKIEIKQDIIDDEIKDSSKKFKNAKNSFNTAKNNLDSHLRSISK
ncbi:hypothetical protein MWH25_04680 [Natroniella acetigena]|uniref:hypothetical protein n=1 Tax=Natroniella acetigena TaxID=52004 RepID=UPI00200B8689|nr:hypothetical protein [Natroniella acetigena]MCK8827042.1 hypothetical protein [Natroniella acetigena]